MAFVRMIPDRRPPSPTEAENMMVRIAGEDRPPEIRALSGKQADLTLQKKKK